MWGLNTTTVPVVMGALAPTRRTWKTTPTKSLAISTCTHDELQKITLLSTAHLLHQVETLFASQSSWFGLGC